LVEDSTESDSVAIAPEQGSDLGRWLRLGALLLVLAGIYAVGKATGWLDRVDIPMLRTTVESAGALGFVIFVALFAAGILLQVPGMVFVATGILLYGKVMGYGASLVGAFVGVCVTFLFARAIGGTALARPRKRWLRAALERLERHPVAYLVAFRLVFFISPPLNYALALTPMRFRDFALGSALGLVVPMAVVTAVFDWLFSTPWVREYLF
jgi:uncharacterized membrane protein YdjX (TVP38/TMEM64 family)